MFASPATGLGIDSRLMDAWGEGTRYVSDGMVHRVGSQIPGTALVFAVATLLRQRHVSGVAAQRAVQELFVTDAYGCRSWRLRPTHASCEKNGSVDEYAWIDSPALSARGDFLGFLAVLALLREAVAIRDNDRAAQHARDLYAMLPSVVAIVWVLPDVDLLLQCLEDMKQGLRWMCASVAIDWQLFQKQILEGDVGPHGAPWIVSNCSTLRVAGAIKSPQRPVPLLQGVVPLQPHVRFAVP